MATPWQKSFWISDNPLLLSPLKISNFGINKTSEHNGGYIESQDSISGNYRDSRDPIFF
jgi:hypothetical protein